jgi:AGZA family xanthine/uracil permease-like MFS transporter
LIIVAIPLTSSISHGIGLGFILFTLIKLIRGRIREVHPLMIAVAAAFVVFFALETI